MTTLFLPGKVGTARSKIGTLDISALDISAEGV